MLIAGRKAEIEVLDDIMQKKTSQFVVVYGRRRVGKTYLINEYFNNAFSFKSVGVKNHNKKSNIKTTMKPFIESLSRYGNFKKKPNDWYEAFSMLEKILDSDDVYIEPISKKKIVLLDELPWFDSPKSNFKEALDYFWNMYGCTKKDLVLIVCGSATSWIVNNLLESKEGFHNRITNRLYLKPLSLKETEELLLMNDIRLYRHQIIECYMAFGGIPYYLNLLSPRYSLAQNIDNLCFKETGALRNELQELFSSLFDKHEDYLRIIDLLANNKLGMTRGEIIEHSDFKSGKRLTKIIDDLIKCSFVRKYKNTAKGKNDIYQLIDHFTLFAYYFIKSEKINSWLNFNNTPGYFNWCGNAFELVCLNNIESIKASLGILGIDSNEYSFRNNDCQIDLVIDRKDSVINLCEMKYSMNEFMIDRDYSQNLLNKIESFIKDTKTKKATILTLITSNGVKRNSYYNSSIKLLDCSDLFVK